MTPRMLVRQVRLVPVGVDAAPAPDAPVDLRLAGGVVTEVGPHLVPAPGEQVHDGGGRWVIPGLWDQHVHLGQWARASSRVEVSGTAGPQEVLDRLTVALAGRAPGLVIGFGYRSALWSTPPTVAALDAVCGDRPVVLVSGDAHNGWVSSAAQRLLGLTHRDEPVRESEWFDALGRLDTLPGARDGLVEAYRDVVARASALGVVGIGDMEFGDGWRAWPDLVAAGVTGLRVRAATYAHGLDEVIDLGLRSGDPLVPDAPGAGHVVMGPLKVISDGSLNTRTAHCCEPYADGAGSAQPRGAANLSPEELRGLLTRAARAGLDGAVHAIGDAAVATALDAFEAIEAIESAGGRGRIEHAQLVRVEDLPRMARLGVTASVQPAHGPDDRDVTDTCWPDRAGRAYAFRAMLDAGVTLALGSDAPVAPLDPWLAMATAVHRSADARPPWHPEQSTTVAEALAASTDGQGTVGPGSRADLALLDADPLAPQRDSAAAATHLRGIRVAATFRQGVATHLAL